MIVLDASIFAKLFREEDDTDAVDALIVHVATHRIPLIAPKLLVYEALSIGLRHAVPFQSILDLLENLNTLGLKLVDCEAQELLQAEEIATSGDKSLGYPDLADSIYHALAISRGGTFVTADSRHYRKAARFGHIVLLSDWKPA